jgi:hypothetical protein
MYRFFKCNVLGGFRLSDLNRNIKQGDYFYIDNLFCDTSRAVRAALQSKWMTEVTEKEASQFVSIPKQVSAGGVQQTEVGPRRSVSSSGQVATPNVQETNKSIESRQAERSIVKRQAMQKQKVEDKPVIPNFNEAERAMRLRQADVTTKGPDEVLRSPVEAKKEAVVVTRMESVKDLAKEIADNSMLSTPNFDEKKDAKVEVSQEIEKRTRRRRKIQETTEVAPEVTQEVNS